MALKKSIKSKVGVTGNYMAVHAVSINNETKRLDYSVALYHSAEAKKEGAEPLEIIYRGHIEKASPENPIAQCYADMKAKAEKMNEYEIPAEEEGSEPTKISEPANPEEYKLFGGAVDL